MFFCLARCRSVGATKAVFAVPALATLERSHSLFDVSAIRISNTTASLVASLSLALVMKAPT